jgi:cytochrome c peroxidase
MYSKSVKCCFMCLLVLLLFGIVGSQRAAQGRQLQTQLSIVAPDKITVPDASGLLQVVFTDGRTFDPGNPFFQQLGTNGRTCGSCHKILNAWSISPPLIRSVFLATRGLDPLFNPVDGTNSPSADVSSVPARLKASSMLLNKGLIRVGLPIPQGAEFTLDAVDDPYHFASAQELSLFRRPLPATNLHFLTGVMTDARESTAPKTIPLNTLDESQYLADLIFDLKSQANHATLGHAQGAHPLSNDILTSIVDFELHTITAQQYGWFVGALDALGATGGPLALSQQRFYVSINDVLGADKLGSPFNPRVFDLYDAWAGNQNLARAQIQRGQELFNTRQFDITGVGGLNDALGVPVLRGTCTTCHDAPNVGNHSVPFPINIGTSDGSRRTADLPLYTLRNTATGETVQTTDPGRALITGHWKDIGKFKGPVLRGLAARPPYFHNGSAASLKDVVEFYMTRFNVQFTDQEVLDLVAFLLSL